MDRRSQLESMNRMKGLIPIAKELKMKNYSRLRKDPLIDAILKYEMGFRPIKKNSKKQLRQTAKILGANPKDDPDDLLQIVTEGLTYERTKIRIENEKISSTIKVTGFFNENLSDQINLRARSLINTGVTMSCSFSCVIYDGEGLYREFHKTLSRLIGMTTRDEVEKAIAECEKRRLDLSDEGVWSGSYLPPQGKVQDQKYYEGIIEFKEIQVKLTHTGEPLIGAGKVVEWLVRSKSVYAPPEKQENMCFWRCLAAFFKVTDLKRSEKAAKDLARRCLGPIRLSKKVSMETISEAAQTMDITITVYHPTWQNGAAVCELRGKFGTGEQIMNIGIVERHCYLIKDLEGLCKIWRCTKCGVAFNRASNLKRHKAEVDCSPEAKVICEGNRVEGILSASDKVFYGTRSGVSLKAAQWIASQEALSTPKAPAGRRPEGAVRRHIHHAYCGHGGERTVEVTLRSSVGGG